MSSLILVKNRCLNIHHPACRYVKDMKEVAWNYKSPADDDDDNDRIVAYKNNFNVVYDKNSINESGETYLQNITSSKRHCTIFTASQEV
jgi:hypothetical protein